MEGASTSMNESMVPGKFSEVHILKDYEIAKLRASLREKDRIIDELKSAVDVRETRIKQSAQEKQLKKIQLLDNEITSLQQEEQFSSLMQQKQNAKKKTKNKMSCCQFLRASKSVIQNTVVATCTFENNTPYPVEIVDHDGTRTLHPQQLQGNYLVRGFSVDLIMKLSGEREVKINFPTSKFENRKHKMSVIFRDYINVCPLEVLEAASGWKFITNHPGGFQEERKVEMICKHSWKREHEIGREAEAMIRGMIQAIELSSSFKVNTKLTQVDEFERQITESSVCIFKDICYLWQEIVVITTNQPAPYHVLEIPTPHTEMTSTPSEPGKNKAIYSR